MTWVDFAVLGVLAVSGLLALSRGFVREVLGLGAWAGAAAFTWWGSPPRPAPLRAMDQLARMGRPRHRRRPVHRLAAHPHGDLRLDRQPSCAPRRSAASTAHWGWYSDSRGAALVVFAYIATCMVIPIDQWPGVVLHARALPLAYDGAAWVVDHLPPDVRPHISAPPVPKQTTAEELFHAQPLGRAVGPPPRLPARNQGGCRCAASPAPTTSALAARANGTTTTSCTRNAACSASGTCPTPPRSPPSACTRLQHRGQEATGIVSYDGKHFHSHKGMGLVGDNFGDARVIARLPGHIAIGHNRYATTGDTILRNVQPLYADFEFGGFAVAHNGNLTNAHVLRRNLVRRGCLFQSTTDSEVFIHLIAISLYSTVVDRLIDALKQVIGAYSLVALSNEALMGVRDPAGRAPADPRPHRQRGHRRLGARLGNLRAGHRRRRLRPRRRARRDRGDQRPGRAQHQAVRPRRGRGSACSNTSISPARIP